ncbi:hypothetical protein VV11_011520 [Trichodesmium erythraeum 21-75]|nr:hypothetical protein [Trichodesmium erythraeum 21-75]
MQNYTPIIISFLLLLGNTSSSQALMTANELELSANFLTQHAGRGNAVNNHGDLETVPSGEGIRKNINFSV